MNVQEEIRKLAYDFYEKSGRLGGRELEHWLRAEQIVMTKLAAGGKAEPANLQTEKTQKTAPAGGDTKPGKTHPPATGKVGAERGTDKPRKAASTAEKNTESKGAGKKKSATKPAGRTKKAKG